MLFIIIPPKPLTPDGGTVTPVPEAIFVGMPKSPILVPTSPKDVLTNIGRSVLWLRYLASLTRK